MVGLVLTVHLCEGGGEKNLFVILWYFETYYKDKTKLNLKLWSEMKRKIITLTFTSTLLFLSLFVPKLFQSSFMLCCCLAILFNLFYLLREKEKKLTTGKKAAPFTTSTMNYEFEHIKLDKKSKGKKVKENI